MSLIIIEYLNKMLPYMILVVPPVVLARLLVCRGRKKRMYKNSARHEVGIVIFAVYLAGLLSQTVLPKIIFSPNFEFIFASAERRLNLMPFDFVAQLLRNYNYSYLLINTIGNICVFIPLGIFIPLLWRGFKLKHTVLCGVLLSLVIETAQYFIKRGTDIDDILLNALGALIGYGVYAFFRNLFSRADEKFKQSRR